MAGGTGHADGKLATVVDVVPEDMEGDLLARVRAEVLALRLGQGVWRLEDVAKVGDGPAGERALDHAPRRLKLGDQFLGGMHRLALLVTPGGSARTSTT